MNLLVVMMVAMISVTLGHSMLDAVNQLTQVRSKSRIEYLSHRQIESINSQVIEALGRSRTPGAICKENETAMALSDSAAICVPRTAICGSNDQNQGACLCLNKDC